MDFRSLPDRPDHPRYIKRLKDVSHLLRQKKDRLVEEGMVLDAGTCEADFWYFCLRCTPFEAYKITERGHPMQGQLWINHPFQFWHCRLLQRFVDEPIEGWAWIKFHRDSHKTTTMLDWMVWLCCRDESETIGLWTHKIDDIGESMGRGLLRQLLAGDRIRDYWPQFRNLQDATKEGFTVDRSPGPREKSVTVASIMTSMTSIHPRRYVIDDIVTEKLVGNPEQIQRVAKNLSALAALLRPDSSVLCLNTPWDPADPLVQREKDGLFNGGVFEAPCYDAEGRPNLHTRKHFENRRREINNDSIFYPQFLLTFHRAPDLTFDWERMTFYDEPPEVVAGRYPYINIFVDGAGGGKDSDFTYIRVATWVAHDAWANLDCIRERVGWSKAEQILLGRDPTDPSTKWVEDMYCPQGVGVVEKWMQYDPHLTIWFDDHSNQGWRSNFIEALRRHGNRFNRGNLPTIKAVPEIHRVGGGTKLWQIAKLDGPYSQGKAAYPRSGFKHGSFVGLAGEDNRDTMVQFRQDEFDRMKLNKLPPFDDGLDTERVLVMPEAVKQMRRPREKRGFGYTVNGRVYPAPTVTNPFGLPRASLPAAGSGMEGRTWASL